jgi:hypothetical protein
MNIWQHFSFNSVIPIKESRVYSKKVDQNGAKPPNYLLKASAVDWLRITSPLENTMVSPLSMV